MKALHANGQIYEASEIRSGSALKSGPWFCPGDGCEVRFKFHRAASYAAGDAERVARQATFVHSDEREHSSECPFNAKAERQRLLNEHASTLIRRGETLLLMYGAGSEPAKPSTPVEPRPAGAVREQYAAVMSTALDIARVVDRIGEPALESHWVRHQGINYTWREFSYGPDAQDLSRLTPSVRGQVTAKTWPRLVRAVVHNGGSLNSSESWVMARMTAVDTLPGNKAVKFWVFARPNTDAGSLLLTFMAEQTYALLGEWWDFMTRTEEASLTIEQTSQVSRLA